MILQDLVSGLKEMELQVAYSHFAEGEVPKCPYIVVQGMGKAYLQSLVTQDENGQYTTGVNYSQAQSKQDGWIRIMYSLCQFMFVTLVLAAGSIIFLKTGNEVYEDKERYRVLEKMGIQTKVLKKSVRNEICFTYYCPFVLMVVTSWFSIHALGNVMKEELLLVNLWSAGIVLVLFSGICLLSVRTARKRLFL